MSWRVFQLNYLWKTRESAHLFTTSWEIQRLMLPLLLLPLPLVGREKKDGSSGQVMPRKSVSRRLKISVGQWQLDLVLKGVGHSTKLNWPLVLTQKWFHTRSIGLQDSGPNTEYTGRFWAWQLENLVVCPVPKAVLRSSIRGFLICCPHADPDFWGRTKPLV